MSDDTTRRLRVRRYKVNNIDYLYFSAYRLKIEITDATGMDTRCFVYRRGQPDAYSGEVTDTFFAVASPVDMADYPPDTPDPLKAYPFFRKSVVELDLRSQALALETEALIVQELNVLVHAMNKLGDLTLQEDFWIGPFPEDESSLADSVSTSG